MIFQIWLRTLDEGCRMEGVASWDVVGIACVGSRVVTAEEEGPARAKTV